MSNYTKVSNAMLEDKRFNLVSTLIYAKLEFRMRLSVKNGKDYVIYKINDLAHDIGVSRGSIINGIKQLVKCGFVAKVHKMFCQLIYLPKSKIKPRKSKKRTSKVQKLNFESSKSGLCNNNKKPRKNLSRIKSHNSLVRRRRQERKRDKQSSSDWQSIIKHYGIDSVRLAFQFTETAPRKVYNKAKYTAGILKNWVKDGLIEDHPVDPATAPKIPLFKI